MYIEFFNEKIINLESESDMRDLQGFLWRHGLEMDDDIEYSVALIYDNMIAATGSFSGKVLKCIAVDDEYKEQGLSAKVVSHLVNEQYRRGRTDLFVYTRPENTEIFKSLGFYPIARVTGKAVLMENSRDGIGKYLQSLKDETASFEAAASARPAMSAVPTGGTAPATTDTFAASAASAAIVVNCNPFTLGHKYLVEYAVAKSELLHVFVVWEDKSLFPSEIRYRLVKEGTAHLNNVIVHKGEDYIISNATFPSYFIKKYEERVETHARLDLEVFTRYIAPALAIKKRFVGKEPYCPVTSVYNNIMKQVLPSHGIEVEEVERLTESDNVISASRVRRLLAEGRMDEVKALVPETTYAFLISPEGRSIIDKMRN